MSELRSPEHRTTLKNALIVLKGCPQDASLCGPHIAAVLGDILENIRPVPNLDTTMKKCSFLITQANEAISTYPYAEVPTHWRRLYMDASLLLVITTLTQKGALKRDSLLELVRVLDLANIVTAYFEKGRRNLLVELMAIVQEQLGSTSEPVKEERPTKRTRYASSDNIQPSMSATRNEEVFLPNIREIRRYTIAEAPQMHELAMYTEPFVVTGGVSHWPAIADVFQRWANIGYLREVAGQGRIVPVEIGSSYTAEGWTQKMMDFDDFLDKIEWEQKHGLATTGASEPTLYLAQHDLFQQFPDLLQDVVPPDYVFSGPEAPESYPEYRPPNSKSGYTINAWMGPKGTYSPAHTDPFYNCYAQVVGSKHIWVAPPASTPYMTYPAAPEEAGEESTNAAVEQYMDNTAKVDVFAAIQAAAESEKVDAFQAKVLPTAMQAILREGDLLFMPPKWWHSLRSLERSFSVSMWF